MGSFGGGNGGRGNLFRSPSGGDFFGKAQPYFNKAYGFANRNGLSMLNGPTMLASGLGWVKDPRQIKQQQQAQVNAQTQGNLAAQRGMSNGLMGGASAGGQIQAYNSVLADAADQRTQLAQADQQSSMQNIGMLMSILGML